MKRGNFLSRLFGEKKEIQKIPNEKTKWCITNTYVDTVNGVKKLDIYFTMGVYSPNTIRYNIQQTVLDTTNVESQELYENKFNELECDIRIDDIYRTPSNEKWQKNAFFKENGFLYIGVCIKVGIDSLEKDFRLIRESIAAYTEVFAKQLNGTILENKVLHTKINDALQDVFNDKLA